MCLPPNYLSLKGWRVKNPKWGKKKEKWAKERISYSLVFTSCTYTNQRLINSLGSHSGLLHTFAIPKDRNFKLLPCSKPESWCYLLLMPTRNLIWVRSLFWFWSYLWKSRSWGGESLGYVLGLASRLQSLFLSFSLSRNYMDGILTVLVAYLKPVETDFLAILENLHNYSWLELDD